jgi:4-amino-4-deoxy-L-arabinose transferase-like glycosyltransferase
MKHLLNPTFKASMLRNSVIQFIWWLIFFPGFYSSDSFSAVEMAQTGNLTNSFTASWAIYVRVFSFFGNAIGLLTIVGGLLLVYAITHFAFSIFTKKTAALASFLMTLTPLVWGMGITLWHDILMTAGLFLVTSFMVRIHLEQKISVLDVISKLILGSILISFRPNGLPTLLVFSFLLLAFMRKRIILKYSLVAISATVLVTLFTSNLILGMSPINNLFAQEWMRNDISCFANSQNGAGFVEKNIPGIGTTDTWKSESACVFLTQAKLSSEEEVRSQKYVSNAWKELIKQEPQFVLGTHLKRNAYLVPLPLHGIPKPPFLHSTIEFENRGIEWAFPSIAEEARAPMRLWNAMRGFTAWAGLWFAVLSVLLLGLKNRELLAPFLMSISLMGVLFVFAPIPDARYALFVLIVGQIALLGKFIEWAQTGSNCRPTD